MTNLLVTPEDFKEAARQLGYPPDITRDDIRYWDGGVKLAEVDQRAKDLARHRISHSLPGAVGIDRDTAQAIYRARRSVEGYDHVQAKLKNSDLRILLERLDALTALTPSALSPDWIASGLPDEAIEAGIEAWRAADVAMEAREHSANPEDMTDWDEGMIVAAIFKAVSRAMPAPSALSGDAP